MPIKNTPIFYDSAMFYTFTALYNNQNTYKHSKPVKPIFQIIDDTLKPILEVLGIYEKFLNSDDYQLGVYAVTFTLLSTLVVSVFKFIAHLLLRHKQRFLSRNLNPWFSDEEIDRATRYYIPTYYQNVSPALDEEPGRFHIASASNPLIPLFTNKVFHKTGAKNKFFLILADAGMGKTTFMINLYLKYKRKWSPFRPKYDIVLFPLGRPEVLEELDKIDDKAKANTILLLDAFDEDTKALGDYKQRMSDTLNKAWRFRAVVITCRTHFFPSEKEQPYLTSQYQFGGEGGEYTFQHLYVSVFSDWDVVRYLHKRFNVLNPINWKKLWQAWQLTRKSQNLIVRPMLLSHIRDLVKQNRNYEYSYQVYEALIDEWIDRESRKPGIREKYGSVEAFKDKIKIFSQELAVDMYNNREKRGGLFIRYDEPFFSETGMSLSGLEEDWGKAVKESELRSRALLNRNAEEYKFAHKSIFEYFIAFFLIKDETFYKKINYQDMDLMRSFLKEMTISNILVNSKGNFTIKESLVTKTVMIQVEIIEKIYEILGIFTLRNKQTLIGSSIFAERLIESIRLNHFPNLISIQISNATNIKISYLKNFYDEFSKNDKIRIILYDKNELKALYRFGLIIIYITLFKSLMLKHSTENKLESIINNITNPYKGQNPRLSIEFKDINKAYEAMEVAINTAINEQSPIIQKYAEYLSKQDFNILLSSIYSIKAVDIKDFIDLAEIEKAMENLGVLKYDTYSKARKLDLIILWDEYQLQLANTFIKECQALQAALPHVEIIY